MTTAIDYIPCAFIKSEDDQSSIISSLSNSSKQNIKQKDIIYTDFNKAFNEVFNRENIIEIEGEDEYINKKDITEPCIMAVEEGNIIQECTNVIINQYICKDKKEKSFPFEKGCGVSKKIENLGLNLKNLASGKIGISQYKDKKFETKMMTKDKNGRMKKLKKRRKYKPDNIRKKIKARFHKDLRKIINIKLKKSGSSQLFDLLPQYFITNISIKLNKKVMGITYGKLLEESWKEIAGESPKAPDKIKIMKNKEVMKYLSENKEIREKSEFEKIKNMKYEDLLKAYFSSAEFENSLSEIYNKNKSEKNNYYLEEYINKAISYVDFFKNM